MVHFALTIISLPDNARIAAWTIGKGRSTPFRVQVFRPYVHSSGSRGNFGQVLSGGSFSQCSLLLWRLPLTYFPLSLPLLLSKCIIDKKWDGVKGKA